MWKCSSLKILCLIRVEITVNQGQIQDVRKEGVVNQHEPLRVEGEVRE